MSKRALSKEVEITFCLKPEQFAKYDKNRDAALSLMLHPDVRWIVSEITEEIEEED